MFLLYQRFFRKNDIFSRLKHFDTYSFQDKYIIFAARCAKNDRHDIYEKNLEFTY